MMKQTLPTCPACKLGHLHPASRVRKFSLHGQTREVELLTSLCDQCGVAATRAAQHKENLSRLAMHKVHYGALLMGEDILPTVHYHDLKQPATAPGVVEVVENRNPNGKLARAKAKSKKETQP
jgi:hypothetical protein